MLRVFAVGLLLVLSGCSTQAVLLVHPQSGATVKCSAEYGEAVGIDAGSFVKSCVEAAGNRGYVPADKLSAEQRAELQRHGFVPFDRLTPQQQSEAQRRGMLPRREQMSLP
jgi:hypothetical protein